LWDFATRVRRMGGPPLVAIAMGPLGALTRLLGGRFDAPLTYASPGPGLAAAPGQIPAADLAMLYRVRAISTKTQVYGVLGQEVQGSLSPILHNNAFAARGLDAVYVPLQAEALAPFVQALPTFGLSGFSVTRPYKVEILKHLSEVDEGAAQSGSVNTVCVRADGSLSGSTSDGLGVVAPLRKRVELKGRQVVILGAGGAARSAALALVKRGARVCVLARRREQAGEVGAAVGCEHGSLSGLPNRGWDVLINATPVGAAPDAEATPVPRPLLRGGSVVFDMVYTPLETRLLREARANGCTGIDGLEMLVAQAAAQFETWTGLEAPVDLMRDAAYEHLQARQP
jgi:shikimate dehydrogenase